MVYHIALLVFGILGLWLFSHLAVVSSIKIAKTLNLTEAFIGLTILSIGTSIPEIATTIMASLSTLKGIDASSIAISTNIGSDIVQLTLVLGIIGLITKIYTNKKIIKYDYPMMIAATIIVFLFSLAGKINRIEGLLLVVLYIAYLYSLLRGEKIVNHNKDNFSYIYQGSLIILGLIGLLYSARLVVTSSVYYSHFFGIDQTFFGALLIGFTSALPELTTALQGFIKKSKGISLGVLIGSNITNPLLVLGIGAMISTFTVSKELLLVDMPFFIVISIIGWMFFRKKMKITKNESIFLILLYIVYAATKFRLIF